MFNQNAFLFCFVFFFPCVITRWFGDAAFYCRHIQKGYHFLWFIKGEWFRPRGGSKTLQLLSTPSFPHPNPGYVYWVRNSKGVGEEKKKLITTASYPDFCRIALGLAGGGGGGGTFWSNVLVTAFSAV